MRTSTPSLAVFGAALVLLSFAAFGVGGSSTTEGIDTAKAKELVLKEFPVLRGKGIPPLKLITNDALKRAFPGYHFFIVGFTVWPITKKAPAPLSTRNLFTVTGAGKAELHKTHWFDPPRPPLKSLEQFFRGNLGLIKDDEAAKDTVEAWLRLSQEFTQDGYFEFSISRDLFVVQVLRDGRKPSGRAIVTQGGKGEIRATLRFTAEGRLSEVEETNTVKPGIRPRCQATKLLDPDPIVRQMAEQDILVMGRAAKPYLDEQRAKVSPELKHAIDRIWQRIVDEGW
jgi:hypothetical protein